ncbi:hypothetical protein O3M35_005752 [Rhynocoris fuscipes]|uniref:Uncharacterized protein n=1 Tax=Rhynocoris fuscipes TaxID=488301 RepID=A0AAW1DJB8_9HEMI
MELSKKKLTEFNEADFSEEQTDEQNGSQGPLREDGNDIEDSKYDLDNLADDAISYKISIHYYNMAAIVFITNYLL